MTKLSFIGTHTYDLYLSNELVETLGKILYSLNYNYAGCVSFGYKGPYTSFRRVDLGTLAKAFLRSLLYGIK